LQIFNFCKVNFQSCFLTTECIAKCEMQMHSVSRRLVFYRNIIGTLSRNLEQNPEQIFQKILQKSKHKLETVHRFTKKFYKKILNRFYKLNSWHVFIFGTNSLKKDLINSKSLRWKVILIWFWSDLQIVILKNINTMQWFKKSGNYMGM
jgi:hypothetical protein